MKLLFVLCFNDLTQKKMLSDENIKIMGRVLEKSIEEKEASATFMVLRLLTFFSRYLGV